MPRAQATTDHQKIRQWIEARDGHPSVVRSTESEEPGHAGLLRVDFNKPEDELEEVSWDEFFDTFDENNLAFLYQDKTASGRKSRFNKFVSRDAVDTQDTEAENDTARATESDVSSGGSSKRRASQMEEEAEEADEDDALEEDEDLADDEDEDER